VDGSGPPGGAARLPWSPGSDFGGFEKACREEKNHRMISPSSSTPPPLLLLSSSSPLPSSGGWDYLSQGITGEKENFPIVSLKILTQEYSSVVMFGL